MKVPTRNHLRLTDHHFYSWACVAAFTIVFVGFGMTYFLRPFFRSTGLSLLLNVHSMLMTSWFVLFLTQTCLIAAHRVDWHRRLGIFGAVLAGLVLMVGSIVIVRACARHADIRSVLFLRLLVAFDGLNLLAFAGLAASAIALRRCPDFHKRLMLLATLSLLPPAIGRIIEIFIPHPSEFDVLLTMTSCVFIALAVDALRHHRLHPAFFWSGLVIIASNLITYMAQLHL